MATDNPTGKPFGYVYIVKNGANQKVYIGQTRRSIRARWHQHVSKARKWVPGTPGTALKKAIHKYGRDQFTITALHECSCQEELDRLEAEEILKHGSMDRAKGYNQKYGGLGGRLSEECIEQIGNTLRGRTLPEATKEKIRAWAQSPEGRASGLKGRLQQGAFSAETIEKFREAGKRKDHTAMFAASKLANTGRPKSPEHREKLSQYFKGRPNGRKGIPQTEEHKAALRKGWEKRKAKYGDDVFSAETRNKLSTSIEKSWIARKEKYGDKVSEETRQKMSAGSSKRWAQRRADKTKGKDSSSQQSLF